MAVADLYHVGMLRAELARLRAEQARGQAHPWAGTCGEDDARLDRIADIEELLLDLQAS